MADAASQVNREEWLTANVEPLRTVFARAGGTLPASIRVSCGWASADARRRGTLIECWAPQFSAQHVWESFVSPILDDSLAVVGALVHGLVHVCLGARHGWPFRHLARRVGLAGSVRSIELAPELEARVYAHIDKLGNYPHARIEVPDELARLSEVGRYGRVECSECACFVLMTNRWLRYGPPTCHCGAPMRPPPPGEPPTEGAALPPKPRRPRRICAVRVPAARS